MLRTLGDLTAAEVEARVLAASTPNRC